MLHHKKSISILYSQLTHCQYFENIFFLLYDENKNLIN